jgi:pimeloyl-ACP methyl ester carboxylesterase
MKSLHALALSLLLTFAAACTAPTERAVGDWHGTMTTPAGELSLVVRISHKGGALAGDMESIDQAPGELIPITITKADDQHLAFAVPSIKSAFTGTWDEHAGGWSGAWMQSGYKFALVLRSGPGAIAVKGMDGTWRATVTRSDGTRRLVLRIATTGDNTTIKFDAPDAGANNLAVANFTRTSNRIRFEVPIAGAKFDGTLSPSGDRIDGTWFFPNQPPAPIAFIRTQNTAQQAPRPRPQLPVPPFPYRVEEVRVANAAAGVTLACTLTEPQGAGPFPAAVLLTGSGAQDRDESMFGHKPFAVIADHLTRQGIAILRCDDRGYGASTGTFDKATSLDFATDADAAVAYLAGRPDIKRNAIGLVGHSEGALVSVITASANTQIAYLVLLGAPGTDLRQVLLSQRLLLGEAQGLPKQWLSDTQPIIATILDAVATARSDPEAIARVRAILTPAACAALNLDAAHADIFVQQMTSPWMQQFLRLDLPGYMSRITVPVLALAGSLDRQVAPDANLAALKMGLAHSRDVTLIKLEGLNHFFQHAKTGAMTEYVDIDETFSHTALQAISHWLAQHVSR